MESSIGHSFIHFWETKTLLFVKIECGSATYTDCSLEEFRKIVLDAVASSSSYEPSGECSDGNIRLIINSGGSTTGRESSDGSTIRVDSGIESRFL